MPAIPLFGAGEVRLQPVYVNDVAAAVAQALATPEAAGQLYELGGPRVYTYEALVRLVLDHSGRRRLLLPVLYAVWHALAALTAPLPRRPISRDQVKLMQKDNLVSPGALTLADLGITPTALEAIAPTYLRRRED
jgi:NADH dehydrogenase